MPEIWDVYDKDLNKIGKDCIRGQMILPEGEYHLVVSAIIINSENKILLAKRAEGRPNGLLWELTGGSVLKGESSEEGIRRELLEEIGLNLENIECKLYKSILSDEYHDIKQIWIFRKDVDIENEIKFNDGETIDVKFVDENEFESMYKNNELLKTIDITAEDLKEIRSKYV